MMLLYKVTTFFDIRNRAFTEQLRLAKLASCNFFKVNHKKISNTFKYATR